MPTLHTRIMSFWDNPIVEKAAAAIIAATAIGFGSMTLSTRDKVRDHDLQLQRFEETRQDIKDIKETVNQVEKDVAVLKARDGK